MEPLPPNIVEHIPFCGSRLLHDQENLWKTTWRFYERFGMNATLQAAVHLGNDYDTHLRHAKNHLWNALGQLIDETKKTDQ